MRKITVKSTEKQIIINSLGTPIRAYLFSLTLNKKRTILTPDRSTILVNIDGLTPLGKEVYKRVIAEKAKTFESLSQQAITGIKI